VINNPKLISTETLHTPRISSN